MKDFWHQNRIYYSPVEFAMNYIGGTWKIPILQALRNGPVRYGDLKKSIPHITDKMLITQLRILEEKSMVTRQVYQEKPPRVDYALTARAKQALLVISHLEAYGAY
ncbi:helix-turn-helix domain-containing protein, partial [Chitinophaga sp.]|uniref:winged helix-turn-helix transcriptional regulator n=1 Tax=Chitinophaga sp. TaxID=1869181 RepID=UPI002CA51E1C